MKQVEIKQTTLDDFGLKIQKRYLVLWTSFDQKPMVQDAVNCMTEKSLLQCVVNGVGAGYRVVVVDKNTPENRRKYNKDINHMMSYD